MKKKVCRSAFLIFGLLLTLAGLGQQKSVALKIMTYNIRHASPPSRPSEIDVKGIAAVIKKHKPDLVALQEVDVNTGRSGKQLHQARAIGELLHMHYYFGKAIDFDGGEYGIAILSKFPIDSAKTVDQHLSPASRKMKTISKGCNDATAVFSRNNIHFVQGNIIYKL